MRSDEIAKQNVSEAPCVADAVLQAEVRHPTEDETDQILVGEQGWRHDRVEYVHRRAPAGVGHRRRSDDVLDRTVPESRPDPLVFAARFLRCRMRRPLDAQGPEEFETN